MVNVAMKFKKMLDPWKKRYDQLREHIKKQSHYFAEKVCVIKAMIFAGKSILNIHRKD